MATIPKDMEKSLLSPVEEFTFPGVSGEWGR
jgi:hypothetical protein